MAAGDIIIPDNTITPELLDKIAAEVQNRILSTSKDPGQYEEVDSLTGITSIPVFQQSGSTYKLVRVLLSILKGVDGKEVHLQSTETHLQWRWTDGMWNNLIAWADLKGDPGDTPVFRTGSSGIEWKYESEEEAAWKVLVTFEVLKLKFADLTAEQIAAFWQAIPEDVLVLFQKPATDAAAEVREQMVQISQNANAAIEAANTAAGNAQDAADNVQDGKTPILESVNAQPGDTPSGDFTANGVDALGNPKYILNLTLPAGKDGQPAVFEQGTTTTVEPNGSASVEVVENGTTPEGNPKYILNFSIPRGQQGPPGAGSGNVSADGTGLISGKKYLFVPSSDDSTTGMFIEYVAPEIPEQIQPDWNATEGKAAILNKPGNATADTSGLMSADQFQKLEKVSPDEYVKKDGSTPFTNEQDVKVDGNATIRFKDSDGTIRGYVGKIANNTTIPVEKHGIWLRNHKADKTVMLRDNGDLTYNDTKIVLLNDDSKVTQSANGLMISVDKKKLDRIGSYTTATTVANLDANYENIEISLNANASLSVNAAGRNYDGLEMNVFVYCPSTRTITIPTSGNYESMCGSSHTCPAGRRVEFNLKCYAGIWHIAKLEQE
ncbi:hypothetical protein M1P97_20030 [Parabacteroides sp. GYB001]|uniref:hypothetical protein n=1 Tax=Parabacteroides leei TaxID=2939491 RepID=UPI002017C45D|nr:hypothetical protein [Parabacteroides leei]MCL3853576.1 hypothetical protein [Parabacteroides leei]